MSLPFPPYCTDEDLAVRACGDFHVLCPKWQTLAAAADGAFATGSPWVLTSQSCDFGGVAAGNVVLLRGPRPYFTGDGALFAVSAAAPGSLTLRRLGLGDGVGAPAAPQAGLTGVDFEVPTLTPQVESACLDVNSHFGIDPNVPVRSPSLVYDPNQELKQAAVLTTLQRQYADLCRTDRGDFPLKLRQVETDLAAVRARLTVRWGKLGQGEAETSVFSTRWRR